MPYSRSLQQRMRSGMQQIKEAYESGKMRRKAMKKAKTVEEKMKAQTMQFKKQR